MESIRVAASMLPSPHVVVYRTIDDVDIEADVFFPSENFKNSPCPLFLFIHGGGWMAGSRKDVSGVMLYEFLQRGFIVSSIDYRLFLEVTLQEQFEDIKAAERWARVDLPEKVKDFGFELSPNNVIVGGGSAGGHLALMVPHLWQQQPLALLVLYAPTNFTKIQPRPHAIEALKSVPPMTPEICKAALFDHAQTSWLPDYNSPTVQPRSHIAHEVTRSGGMGEFLARCFTSDFELPKPGSVPHGDILSISPALLLLTSNHPPVFHAMGTDDIAFEISQVTDVHDKLNSTGVICESMILKDTPHAFDQATKPGGEVHRNVMVPAVDFVCQTLRMPGDQIVSRGLVTIERPTDSWGS